MPAWNDPLVDDEDPDPLFAALMAGGELLEVLEQLAPRPAWHAHASCRGLGPARWYLAPGGDPEPAQAVCSGCPVQVQCREAAVDEGHGIWAGEAPTVRLRRRRSAA